MVLAGTVDVITTGVPCCVSVTVTAEAGTTEVTVMTCPGAVTVSTVPG
jgi:hypothetical protein